MINTFLLKRPKIVISMFGNLTKFALPETSQNQFKNIFTQELTFLFKLFHDNKFEIKIAGGAVRDLLMGLVPHDIDFASDATPTDMKNMFIKHNIRLINANGESHGTITPRINDKENFEITTLRYDKVTDGRRAEVVFTKDWKVDAERRDLTINSMFLDMNGIVYDYFNGREDIETRTIQFVGDCNKRIQEDYLRILRYFRFYGRIARKPDEHNLVTLNRIRENGQGLQRVSGERIWIELRKILSGNFVPQILEKMKGCELFPFIGLTNTSDLSELTNRFQILQSNNSHPAVILSTLLTDVVHLKTAMDRLKCSNEDFTLMLFMIKNRYSLMDIANKGDEELLKYCKDTYIMHVGDPPQIKLRQCFSEYFKYINRMDLKIEFDNWKAPTFPIRGNLISLKWQIKGKKLGSAIQFLKKKWKDTGYDALDGTILDDTNLKEEFTKSATN